MPKTIVNTPNAPAPIGPYNQSVVIPASKLVFTSGQIAIDPTTNQLIDGDVRVQTRRVFENIKAILEAAGTSLENVVKTTVFLKSMNDFAAMNEEYAKYLSGNSPARSTVEAARLPKDVLVEIDCIALIEK
ncbi:RidA family protein [bacterium]|nr:RidA family protein [bacterium]